MQICINRKDIFYVFVVYNNSEKIQPLSFLFLVFAQHFKFLPDDRDMSGNWSVKPNIF